MTPGEGGTIWIAWGEDFAGEAKIEVWKSNEHLRTVSEIPLPEGQEPIRLIQDYHLEKQGNQTILRFVQSGFDESEDWNHEYDSLERGWT